MKRLLLCGTALAMTLAGAFPLWAGEREEAWGALLRRCDGRMSRVEERQVDRALRAMSPREKAAIRARLKRIEALTQAWVRAERQARCAAMAKAMLGVVAPTCGVQVDLEPAFRFIMELNGLGGKPAPAKKRQKML